MTEIAIKTGQNLQELIKKNPQIKNPNKIYVGQHIETGKQTETYTVKRGDTLNEIAKQHNTSVSDILRANPGQIANRNLIYPGQKLHIPAAKQANQPQPTKQSTTKQPTTKPTETKTPPTEKPQSPASTKPNETTPPKVEQPKATNNENTKQTSSSTSGWKVEKVSVNDFFTRKQGATVLAAVVIGHAEGNIDTFGKPKKDYYGHKDPGDGKWNIGSFSRANARFPKSPPARTPQEADQMHLKTLQSDAGKFTNALEKAGLDPENVWLQSTYFDALNQAGPDIANKMLEPKQLAYVKQNGVTPETMKEWRMRGFINRDTGQRWVRQSGRLKGVPFGSAFKTEKALSHDQQRRADAITEVLKGINLIKKTESNQTKVGVNKEIPVSKPNMPETKTVASNKTELTRSEIKIPYVELKAGNNIRLSPLLVEKIKNIAFEYKQATGKNLTITDGDRTPLEQSYMMIKQIRRDKLGIYGQKNAAMEIKQAYDKAKAQGKSDDQIAQDINLVIKKQIEKGIYISPHLTNKGADVRFWDMSPADKAKFIQIVNKNGGQVVKENDHFHLQFK